MYHQYPGSSNAADVIKQYLAQLTSANKPTIYQQGFQQGKVGDDYMLEFLVEGEDKGYLEFHIHRFVSEAGMVNSYQFTTRNFKRTLSELHKEINTNKSRWIKLVSELKATDFEE